MASRGDLIARLMDPGIIAVVRAPRAELVPAVAAALVEGGVVAIEITLTTPDALSAIRATSRLLGSRVLVGVGTVLTPEAGREALAAGAEFVVSPICRPALVAMAHAADKPVMIGAYTPTEAQLAHEAGADFVKLFPADGLGATYVKALRAPLPHLRLVPTGGVDLDTIPKFIQAGCVAVGAGSALVSTGLLESEDWPQLTRLARQFVAAIEGARSIRP